MKGDQRKQCDPQLISGAKRENSGRQQRAKYTMKQDVMESLPQEGLVSKCSRRQVHRDSEAVQIRCNAGQGNEPAIARVVRGFDTYDPTRKEVGYRRHSEHYAAFSNSANLL